MMGTEDNGVPLVSDIYRKCASFFSEVDNMITLESFEYAENKLLVAGANAKQACSKFMQVMLPDFLTDSLQDTYPSLEENGSFEVPDSVTWMSDKGHTNGRIISSYFSVEEDTLAGQATDDGVGENNFKHSPNVVEDTLAGQTTDDGVGENKLKQSPNVPIVDDSSIMADTDKRVEQSTSQSNRAMDMEEKCECVEVSTGTEVHKASDCPRMKMHRMQQTQESESVDEDNCESDWEII